MRKIRPRALERAGYACERCDARMVLDVHHVDGDSTNNSENNLRVLCHDCHVDEHRDA